MTLSVNSLRMPKGANRDRKRVGRGPGSGWGKTAGRGSKGQHAHNTVRPGFEGGQTPLHRRLPRFRGFKNHFATGYAEVNVSELAVFAPGTEVTPELLVEKRIVRDLLAGVKILGDGEIGHALTVRAHKFSKGAAEKLAAAGGTVEVIG